MAAEALECILCRQPFPDGKHGLYLRGRYICPGCEAKLISISIDDPVYKIYLKRLKKIWSQAG